MSDLEAASNYSPKSGKEITGSEGYKATYIELSSDVAFSHELLEVLSFLPNDVNLADLAFRRIKLPTNPQKRKKRIEEITAKGTDRTRRWHLSNFSISRVGLQYADASRKVGVKQEDVILCLSGESFQKVVQKTGLRSALNARNQGNAVLVYDTKTENGLKRVSTIEYTFKNLRQKNLALLGIVAIK